MDPSGSLGIPGREMSKEAQTAFWYQSHNLPDSGIMSGATTTAHSIKGDDDDEYMKTTTMSYEWEPGFTNQEYAAMDEQFVTSRRYVLNRVWHQL